MSKRAQGFTLMELMIAVAIVGILAAIAFPSYREYVKRANRADAMQVMQQMAQQAERFFTQNNGYTNPGDPDAFKEFVEGVAGFSDLKTRKAYDTDGITVASTAVTFEITLEPTSGGPNDGDGDLVIRHDGTKLRGGKSWAER